MNQTKQQDIKQELPPELLEVFEWLQGKRKLLTELKENELYNSLVRSMDLVGRYASQKDRDDVMADYQRMAADMTELAAINVWLSALIGRLEAAEKQAEWQRRKKRAELSAGLVKDKSDGKIASNLTQTMMDRLIELDPAYQEYQRAVLEAFKVGRIIRYSQDAIKEVIQVLKINLRMGTEAESRLAGLQG